MGVLNWKINSTGSNGETVGVAFTYNCSAVDK
jgi:hypothetical protein